MAAIRFEFLCHTVKKSKIFDMTTWTDVLAAEKQKDYFKDTLSHVAQRRAEGVNVFPPSDEVFSAFKNTAFDNVKVVILGQDPYHGPGQARLAFSVCQVLKRLHWLICIKNSLKISLVLIFQPRLSNAWAEQGVLLLTRF